MRKLLPYIIAKCEKAGVKQKVEQFPSGAIMIDIWIANRFFVVQIDGDAIGLSEVTEDTSIFDTIPDKSFNNPEIFMTAFENIFPDASKRIIIINGNNFSTLEGFFIEADRVLTKDISWKTGHNFSAFNDLLCGGFGVHEYDESIKLVWQNSVKSRRDLNEQRDGNTIYDILVEIISNHADIEFEER